MACRTCGGRPSTPYRRSGFPTVYSWGPYSDHQPASEQELIDFLEDTDAPVQPKAH